MTQHFIHYIPRRIGASLPQKNEDLWFATSQDLGAGFRTPEFHTTRSKKGAAMRVRKGDVIWIVGQLFSPWGMLPPGVDAMIRVRDIVHGSNGSIKFIASKSSKWLPLANATGVLRRLRTITIDGRGRALLGASYEPDAAVGRYLQSMRHLESGEPLVKWTERLASRPLSFISYRLCDGTERAFYTASRLIRRGQTVFWDRWCLPRRLAERREFVSNAALDRYLMQSLRNSQSVWGVESPAYHEPTSYAAREYTAARALGIYRRVPFRQEKTCGPRCFPTRQ
ncbi:hypothetical protein SAMN02787142_3221 [Burkholderia sp. WP9]|uniref:hypothetical protein n=1 Tax=Burkholderia sp. WP9 TaxID=1500263 RepID=UPI00089A69C2|nr:hypothetical protein [Burkholderia sp. WP9]SED46847.1 hypothetical protein SAMN02787142_3221 [Burkholderia sp. WP9]